MLKNAQKYMRVIMGCKRKNAKEKIIHGAKDIMFKYKDL